MAAAARAPRQPERPEEPPRGAPGASGEALVGRTREGPEQNGMCEQCGEWQQAMSLFSELWEAIT